MSGTDLKRENRKEKVFIRMNEVELSQVKANADKYCGGNVSKWMRIRASMPMLDISIRMQNEIDGGLFNEADNSLSVSPHIGHGSCRKFGNV
jgi:hypothetical protein